MKKIIAVRIHTTSLFKQQNQSDEHHKEIEMKTLVVGYVGRIISDYYNTIIINIYLCGIKTLF